MILFILYLVGVIICYGLFLPIVEDNMLLPDDSVEDKRLLQIMLVLVSTLSWLVVPFVLFVKRSKTKFRLRFKNANNS